MKSERKIFFTTIPKLSELKYFIAIIDFKQNQNENYLSNYNRQKMKTRQLIENFNDILASPVQDKICYIHVITREDSVAEKKLEIFTKELNLRLMGPHLLNTAIYLECIRYSLTVKLFSEWNQVNNYYLKSQYFFNSNMPIESVQLNFLIKDGCLAFSVWALKLKLPKMCLSDLGVDFQDLQKKGFVDIKKKVYILPQLKPATAVAVHLNIPSSCPFINYNDIRNHWENMYGYHLPEKENQILYVEVIFGWSNITYTYPIICVCPYEPIQFRSENEFKTINNFAMTLAKKFTHICGQPIEIIIKPENIFYPISKLYLASEVIDNPNLLKLASDNQIIQDFYKESDISKSRSSNRSSFFPAFAKLPSAKPQKIIQEKFICSSIFTPKVVPSSTNQDFFKFLPSSKPKRPHLLEEGLEIARGKYSHNLSGEVVPKKFKSNELEILARTRKLKKLTVPSLMTFCKENCIPVKSKEKKELIMQKIYDYFSVA